MEVTDQNEPQHAPAIAPEVRFTIVYRPNPEGPAEMRCFPQASGGACVTPRDCIALCAEAIKWCLAAGDAPADTVVVRLGHEKPRRTSLHSLC